MWVSSYQEGIGVEAFCKSAIYRSTIKSTVENTILKKIDHYILIVNELVKDIKLLFRRMKEKLI